MSSITRPRPRTIDFRDYISGTNIQKVECASAFVQSLHETGFCKLTAHSVPRDVVDCVFAQTDKFFKLPESIKAKIKHPPIHNPHRGWSEIGREVVSTVTDYEKGVVEGQEPILDIKEAFDMGNPEDPLFQNIWLPEEHLPGFRNDMERFYDECRIQHLQLLEALQLGCRAVLGVDVDFQGLCQQSASECRINYYPPTKTALLGDSGRFNRISPHADFGTLTLLFQDSVGGLEIEDQSNYGHFFPVTCASNYEMLVNAGDMLQRWTNDYFRSVNHKVTLPQAMKDGTSNGSAYVPARRSVAFFAKPDREVDAGSLSNFVEPSRPEKYEHMTALQYNQIKLNLTYGTKPMPKFENAVAYES